MPSPLRSFLLLLAAANVVFLGHGLATGGRAFDAALALAYVAALAAAAVLVERADGPRAPVIVAAAIASFVAARYLVGGSPQPLPALMLSAEAAAGVALAVAWGEPARDRMQLTAVALYGLAYGMYAFWDATRTGNILFLAVNVVVLAGAVATALRLRTSPARPAAAMG